MTGWRQRRDAKRPTLQKEYRKYIVKGEALDDLRMMKEVVVRWAKRQEEWPDLLLVERWRDPPEHHPQRPRRARMG